MEIKVSIFSTYPLINGLVTPRCVHPTLTTAPVGLSEIQVCSQEQISNSSKSLITQHRSVYLVAVTIGSKEQDSSIIRTPDEECLEKVKEEQLNRYSPHRTAAIEGEWGALQRGHGRHLEEMMQSLGL